MPREGYKTLTLETPLLTTLQDHAKDKGVSVPKLLFDLVHQDPKGCTTPDDRFLTPHVRRVLTYLEKAGMDPAQALERFLRSPTVFVPKPMPSPQKVPLTISQTSNQALIKETVNALRDLDPEGANKLEDRLKHIDDDLQFERQINETPTDAEESNDVKDFPHHLFDPDKVPCPDKNGALILKVKCEVCKAQDFNKWKACQEYQAESHKT